MKQVINPIITYNDYRKFTKFLDNQYKLPINNINPIEYFKLENFQDEIDLDKLTNSFFKKRYVSIPEFKRTNPEFNPYSRFEDFTSKDEVINISLWALSVLSMIGCEGARLGKELEIPQANNPRDGRLDVVTLDHNDLVILESKVNLKNALTEGRFRYQVPEYRNQATKIVTERGLHYKINAFLLLGGEETDLFPPNSPDCTTGKVGNLAKIFYDNLQKYSIKFISANAFWCLNSYAYHKEKNVSLREILEIMSDENTVGLLSGGKVYRKNGEILIGELGF